MPNTNFHRLIAAHPEGGAYRSRSPIDQIERRYIIRRLEGTSLYLSAGIEDATLRREWMVGMAHHLIFGLPATLLMFAMLFFILRRTQTLYAEVDARTTAEQALRQSQKMEAIGQLTGGVAHDFNNLLTIIIGNLERCSASCGDRRGARSSARIDNAHARRPARRDADPAAAGVLAAAAAQPAPRRRQPADARPVRLPAPGARRDIALEIVGGAGLWQVEADAPSWKSALLNLAVNARDAMPDGGKLTIETSNCLSRRRLLPAATTTSQPGQYVLIAVTDTGSGMTKRRIERAFEPFFTTKEAGKGTGLG